MKTSRLIITIISFIFISFTHLSSIAGTNLSNLPVNEETKNSLSPMLKKAMPSVVNIKIYNRQRYAKLIKEQESNPHFNPRAPHAPIENGLVGMGSGVIINDKDGLIVTNNHVVDDAETILVTLHDGRKVNAKLIGSDPDSDLALIKVSIDNITALRFADSEKAEIGDFVVAIGSPFNLNQTVTSGIISGKGRMVGLESYEDFIQTDASINPGNSGGALINLKGELVGINTAILAPDGGSIGIGFAIPTNMATVIIEQLLQFGKVRRGLLGVIAQTLTPELATAFGDPNQKGALIDTITRDSIAFNSDLKIGDIIDEVDGHKINSAAELRNTIGLISIGKEIKMHVVQDGRGKNITLKLVDPKELKTRAQKAYPALAGVYIDSVENINIPHIGNINGLQLLDVVVDSPAWQQGLRPNDIIISANKKKTSNLKDLEKAIVDKNKPLLLQVARNNTSFFMAIKSTS